MAAYLQQEDIENIQNDGSWIISRILQLRRKDGRNEILISWVDSCWMVDDESLNKTMEKIVKIHQNQISSDNTSYSVCCVCKYSVTKLSANIQ